MKTLYIDCSMGVAGDMLAAALLELMPDRQSALARLNAIGIPGVEYSLEKAMRGGIAGSHIVVRVNGKEEGHCHHHHHDEYHCHEHEHAHEHCHDHEHEHCHGHEHHHHHEHHSLNDVLGVVHALNMPQAVKDLVEEVYRLIADAESRAHDRPVGEIHFHEVGAMDAVADISAVSLLMSELGVDNVVASPVNMGGGTVKCAHGVLPVPAPATAFLLEGVPAYADDPSLGELCTPTGAALVKHFARSFGPMPPLNVSAIGYGAGGKDFEGRANLLRVSLGESASGGTDEVLELACNVDDMTGEEMSFASDRIFAAGALDVATIPVQMKKGRPGVIFNVLCAPSAHDAVVSAMFKYTTTLGVREKLCRRYVLSRREETTTIAGGASARRKISEGWGVRREKIEFDDLAKAALASDVSLREAASHGGK